MARRLYVEAVSTTATSLPWILRSRLARDLSCNDQGLRQRTVPVVPTPRTTATSFHNTFATRPCPRGWKTRPVLPFGNHRCRDDRLRQCPEVCQLLPSQGSYRPRL